MTDATHAPIAHGAAQPTAGSSRTHAVPNRRRTWLRLTGAALLVAGAGLSGCANLNMLSSEVTTFGSWPAERKPASFAFDRLPSQQARLADQEAVEKMALPALQAAGFVLAAEGSKPDVLVQLGARFDRQQRSPWDDPLWMNPWGPRWGMTPWAGPRWRYDPNLIRPDYQREVAVLIRDRNSGEALYEARATTDGATQGSPAIFSAMFSAALQAFPATQAEPHLVRAALP